MSVPTPRDAVFVTGATGLLGGLVVQRLLAARPERRVYALARDPSRLPSLAGLVPVRGDVTLPALGIAAPERM